MSKKFLRLWKSAHVLLSSHVSFQIYFSSSLNAGKKGEINQVDRSFANRQHSSARNITSGRTALEVSGRQHGRVKYRRPGGSSSEIQRHTAPHCFCISTNSLVLARTPALLPSVRLAFRSNFSAGVLTIDTRRHVCPIGTRCLAAETPHRQ